MTTEIRIPDLGGADDVEVIELLVSVGDQVQAEDPLLTLESDKASMDVPATSAGTVSEIKVAVGDTVKQGDLIMLLQNDQTLPAEEAWGQVITDLLGDLERVQARRVELGTQIEKVFLSHPLGQVLVTLCGFGPRTGARTLAEIGDPNRFETGSRLASYAGLAPTDWRSGKSINGAFQHRGGNHRLKNAMFLAAFVATQHDPDARAYYQRKRDEGKKHNAAVICVARRRCDLILAMLKTATRYNPGRHENLPIAA